MGSEKEEYIKPVSQKSGEQLELVYDYDESSEFNVVMAALVKRMGNKLVSRHNQAYFGFREIKEFTRDIGKSTQEAGKIFTRFYNGLEEYGVRLPNVETTNITGIRTYSRLRFSPSY